MGGTTRYNVGGDLVAYGALVTGHVAGDVFVTSRLPMDAEKTYYCSLIPSCYAA